MRLCFAAAFRTADSFRSQAYAVAPLDAVLASVSASRRHQRIFKLAKPISTKITVMIQKRTITLGSAQPLSSK